MKRLHYVKPNNLSLLHDELHKAIPSLVPTRDASGVGTPNMVCEGQGDDIWLTVPDLADEAAIARVVTAHDSTASRPATASQQRKARLRELLLLGDANWTADQRQEFLVTTGREVAQ